MIKEDIRSLLSVDNKIAVVYWMTHGDGNITIPRNGKNGYFQVSHVHRNLDYIQMKAAFLSNITTTKYKEHIRDDRGTRDIHLWTACHPLFTKIRDRVYLDKRKVLCEHGIKMLTPMCLAILYQDDGRYSPEKSTISINKPMYSEPELMMLAKFIVDKYGIIFRIRKSSVLKNGDQGYELGLRYSDRDSFFSLIEPYIVPSMAYKIGKGSPSDN